MAKIFTTEVRRLRDDLTVKTMDALQIIVSGRIEEAHQDTINHAQTILLTLRREVEGAR